MAQRQQPRSFVPPDPPVPATDLPDPEPEFTLKGRDRTAPATIRDWALRAARAGSNVHKIGTAILESVEMEAWQQRHGSKIPD